MSNTFIYSFCYNGCMKMMVVHPFYPLYHKKDRPLRKVVPKIIDKIKDRVESGQPVLVNLSKADLNQEIKRLRSAGIDMDSLSIIGTYDGTVTFEANDLNILTDFLMADDPENDPTVYICGFYVHACIQRAIAQARQICKEGSLNVNFEIIIDLSGRYRVGV